MLIFHSRKKSQFFHPSVDGHLDCFQFLAVRATPAVNIHIHVFLWICALVMELLSHRGGVHLGLVEIAKEFYRVIVPLISPPVTIV